MPEIFIDGHTFICGMTQTGKTYYALKNLGRSSLPCLFINPQKVDVDFIDVDMEDSVKDIVRALKRGEKLNYVPSANMKTAKAEVDYIVQALFEAGGFEDHPAILAFDEVHLLARQGDRNEYIDMIPTRGYALGFRGVFIAQRPALVDKTIITQCSKHVIFHTEYEAAYFKTKGLDPDDIVRLLGNAESDRYNYVVYEKGQISGPFREK